MAGPDLLNDLLDLEALVSNLLLVSCDGVIIAHHDATPSLPS
jgi:hypothetical protein